jgi:hypothetical protein
MCALVSAATCVAASAASAASQPLLSLSFGSGTSSIGSADPLTLTIAGGDAPVAGLAFQAYLPAGLNVAASSSSECGGMLTTTPAPQPVPPTGGLGTPGSPEIQLSGASVAAGGSCSFSLPVLVQGAGSYSVTVGPSDSGTYSIVPNAATASLIVPATASAATVMSAFTPSTVVEPGTSTSAVGTTSWSVVITNPNPSTALTDVRFLIVTPITSDGMLPEAITGNSCGGIGEVVGFSPGLALSPGVDYGGGSLAPGARCAVTVTMSIGYPFEPASLPVTIVSNEGGASGASTATVTAVVPERSTGPVRTPSNVFTTAPPKVARDGTISLSVTLPGRGTIELRETWKGRLIADVKRTVKTKKTLTITLAPNASIRRMLTLQRAAQVKLSVAYTPTGGKTRTVTVTGRTQRSLTAADRDGG